MREPAGAAFCTRLTIQQAEWAQRETQPRFCSLLLMRPTRCTLGRNTYFEPPKPPSMKTLFLPPLAAVLLLTSCASLPRTDTAKYMHIVGPGVLHHPVIADLEVKNTKVSATAVGSSSDKEILKVQATATAIREANADVLVEPVFNITPVSSSKIEVTATGFPANYKNFRPATQADLPFIEAGAMHPAKVAEVTTATQTKKGGAGIAVIVVLSILGLVAAVAGGGL